MMLSKQAMGVRSVRGGAARRCVAANAAARRSWAPGVPAPAHLTGE
jgi:hypothetical protein